MDIILYGLLNIIFGFMVEFLFYQKNQSNNRSLYIAKIIGLGVLVIFAQGTFTYFYLGMLAFVNFIVIKDLQNA